MIWTAFVVFFVLWMLGVTNVIPLGPWVWVFLVFWIAALIGLFLASPRRKPGVP
jgi:hypothetical protein